MVPDEGYRKLLIWMLVGVQRAGRSPGTRTGLIQMVARMMQEMMLEIRLDEEKKKTPYYGT